MAMMSFAAAWKRFATPGERAVASATRDYPADVVTEVIERARQGGFIVTFGDTTKGKRKRGRRR